MSFFGFFKRGNHKTNSDAIGTNDPYEQASVNRIYNLLFCGDLSLYKSIAEPPYPATFDALFAEKPDIAALEKIASDEDVETRIRLLAFNRLRASGKSITMRTLLGVVVEIHLKEGLDVLASYNDGTARYINHSGNILVWENNHDVKSNALNAALFANSKTIIEKIGPWEKPRKHHPAIGNARITFLVSDGLYFGEAASDILFGDSLAGPALSDAAKLAAYLVGNLPSSKSGA